MIGVTGVCDIGTDDLRSGNVTTTDFKSSFLCLNRTHQNIKGLPLIDIVNSVESFQSISFTSIDLSAGVGTWLLT